MSSSHSKSSTSFSSSPLEPEPEPPLSPVLALPSSSGSSGSRSVGGFVWVGLSKFPAGGGVNTKSSKVGISIPSNFKSSPAPSLLPASNSLIAASIISRIPLKSFPLARISSPKPASAVPAAVLTPLIASIMLAAASAPPSPAV